MFQDFKSCAYLTLACVLTLLPIGASAGGTPEDVKAFKENKAKAEAGEGFPGNDNYFGGRVLDVAGKAISADSPTPGAIVANAYLSGIGVDRDESEALLWYLRTKGQKGVNEEGFKALITSMSANQVYAVIRRSRSEESETFYRKFKATPIEADKVFRPLSDLRASSRAEGNFSFSNTYGDFLWQSAWVRSKRVILEQFNSFSPSDAAKAAPHVLSAVYNGMYDDFRFHDLSIDISFTPGVPESDKAVFATSSSRLKDIINALIANPGAADSASLQMVADAYAKGRFGLSADPEQHKRWETLANDARVSEAKLRREEADSSGPEVWLQLANETKWASPDVKNILSKDSGDWASRSVEVLTMKAEAGDRVSIDGLIGYYGAIVRDGHAGTPGQGKGIHADTYEREQLIRWVSERHKLSNTPDDAIILAHHFFALGQSAPAKRMVSQYLTDLTRKAKEGSLQDMLKVALLADPNWYEHLEGGADGFPLTLIFPLFRTPRHGEFHSFREHGRLLKSFGKVGREVEIYIGYAHEGSATNPFNDPGFAASSRWSFVRYVEEFVKRENLKGPLLDDVQDYADFITVLRYLAEQDQLAADKYHEIKGGSRDHDVSLRWHRMLGEMGDHYALLDIASSYEQGRGVPRDPASAYAYYALAGGVSQWGNPFVGMGGTYRETVGTNEQKLDACFKLSPADKERALKIYNELASKLIDRLNRLAAKGGEQMAKRDLQAIRDYQAQMSGKAKTLKR
jgi:TPR repeat protein